MASFAINGSESRSFTILGCLGDYDLSKFAQLDRICDECYILYREPELNFSCRYVFIIIFSLLQNYFRFFSYY